MTDKAVVLAHEKFPDHAKTAVGILRYSDYDVVGILDRDRAGTRVNDHLEGVPDAPIVSSIDEIDDFDVLIIGIAPIGGGFDDSWRPDVCGALERGCDVVSGLHYFLNEDGDFARLADENDAEIWDVRKPHDDLTVSEGVADQVDAEIILTVGTDCSVGKMTATLELLNAFEERGEDAAFIPTGQTGIMIEGWGNPVDRVISDFVAGSVEEMILERGDDNDYLLVEGQGSIFHPAYSAVTCGILHGAMPDSLVLCHEEGRERINGYEKTSLPPLETYVDTYENLATPVHETRVAAGVLNTRTVEEDEEARRAVDEFSDEIGVPATDPIRFDMSEVVNTLL